MKSQSIYLGKILGIPIGLDYSWFLIFILLTWTLATGYFPQEFKGWPVAEYWAVGSVTALMLFVSVLLHELGHSVVALRYNIPVRKITLFIFGGIAQIAAEPPYAAAEFWIAIAGPLVSFTLAGLFGILQLFVPNISPLLALAKYLAYINGTLGLFNLIPGFPLDGGRIFRAIIWWITHNLRKATLIAANLGRVIAFLFIIFGVWQVFKGNLVGGIWIAFIGWFLESAANAQVQQQLFHDLLAGHTVSQAMNRNYAVVTPDVHIRQLVENQIFGSGSRFFVVRDGEKVLGFLTLHNIHNVPKQQWETTTATEIMSPVERIHWLGPDLPLNKAMALMDQDGISQMPVMQDGKVIGMLTRESLINFLRTLQEINHTPSVGHPLVGR